METTVSVVLYRANVPDEIKGRFTSSGVGTDISVPLKDIDAYALDRLCREFREDVFKTAGKEPPPQQACEKCGCTLA